MCKIKIAWAGQPQPFSFFVIFCACVRVVCDEAIMKNNGKGYGCDVFASSDPVGYYVHYKKVPLLQSRLYLAIINWAGGENYYIIN